MSGLRIVHPQIKTSCIESSDDYTDSIIQKHGWV